MPNIIFYTKIHKSFLDNVSCAVFLLHAYMAFALRKLCASPRGVLTYGSFLCRLLYMDRDDDRRRM